MIIIVMRQISQILMVCLVCSATTVVSAEEARIYRWVAEDGSVTFSSQPPPAGIKGEAMDVPTPQQVIVQDPAVLQRQLQRSEALGQALDAQRQQREQSQLELNEAEEALRAAEQALAAGHEPQAGEVQRISTGTRLLPSYFERIKQLEAAVAAAKQRVEDLKK
ncbi:MAG: DUF4124 domain-containing protein [Gammaproteobacteria bacterium]|nr:DUF4124 domain-containing protein [Gammaproteobacteria bacterium]